MRVCKAGADARTCAVRAAYMEMGTRRWGDPGLSDSGSTRQILRLPSGAKALLSASGEPKGKSNAKEGTHGWA